MGIVRDAQESGAPLEKSASDLLQRISAFLAVGSVALGVGAGIGSFGKGDTSAAVQTLSGEVKAFREEVVREIKETRTTLAGLDTEVKLLKGQDTPGKVEALRGEVGSARTALAVLGQRVEELERELRGRPK